MKTVIYACDNKGCKSQSEDKNTVITIIKYNLSSKTSRKGVAKHIRLEKHYCSEECLRVDNGYKEIEIQK